MSAARNDGAGVEWLSSVRRGGGIVERAPLVPTAFDRSGPLRGEARSWDPRFPGRHEMRYTLWHHDTLVGETDFGFGRRGGSRAGVLHPTLSGMAVLPALTAMAPALFAADAALKRFPLSDEDIELDVDGAIEAFASSPEGRRVLRAAEELAALELRDSSGRPVAFDSILVSDVQEMAALGAVLRRSDMAGSDPVRYVISATFSDRRAEVVAAAPPH